MSSKADKERAKQIQDKCQVLLNQMLKDEDNKYCVDCDAKGPRWASWNIGIFLCIRCAGIHRNLGVHISRVKSVNLDSWTPEQVVSLQQMGNSRARAVYEANLPDDFRRPQSDSALEQFIRAKYENKKYIAREWVPPVLPKVNWDKELDEEAEKQKRKKRDPKQTTNPTSNIRLLPSVIAQPLPKPVSTSPKPNRTKMNPSPTADLLGLVKGNLHAKIIICGTQSEVKSSVEQRQFFLDYQSFPGEMPSKDSSVGQQPKQEPDPFSNFMSAPNPAASLSASNDSRTLASDSSSLSKRSAEEDSFFNQPATNSPAKSKQQLSTDSILALYGKSQVNPSPFAAPAMAPPGGMFGPMQPPHGASAFPSSEFMMPNGTGGTSLSMQNDVFASMPNSAGITSGNVHPATASLNIVSNPFYNMTGGVPVNSQLFPVSRESPATSNGTSASSGIRQLPQQLGGMSLGGQTPQSGSLLNPLLSSQSQQAPVINSVFNLQQQQSMNPLGQTLASNLWQ